jgi:hypothetical protein
MAPYSTRLLRPVERALRPLSTGVHGCAILPATEARPPWRPAHPRLAHDRPDRDGLSAPPPADGSVEQRRPRRHRTTSRRQGCQARRRAAHRHGACTAEALWLLLWPDRGRPRHGTPLLRRTQAIPCCPPHPRRGAVRIAALLAVRGCAASAGACTPGGSCPALRTSSQGRRGVPAQRRAGARPAAGPLQSCRPPSAVLTKVLCKRVFWCHAYAYETTSLCSSID